MRLLKWIKRQQARVKWLWEEDCLHPITITVRSLTSQEARILGPSHFAVSGVPHHKARGGPYVAKLAHGPMVSSVSDMEHSERAFKWGDHGYFPVYFDITRDGWRVVWPLPLWVCHVIGHQIYVGLAELYRRHWLRTTVSIGMQPRVPRDLRPCLPRNWRPPKQ